MLRVVNRGEVEAKWQMVNGEAGSQMHIVKSRAVIRFGQSERSLSSYVAWLVFHRRNLWNLMR